MGTMEMEMEMETETEMETEMDMATVVGSQHVLLRCATCWQWHSGGAA